jgi:hypothetical protein
MNMTDWNNMLEQTRAAIAGYEMALDSMGYTPMLKPYVIRCENIPLAFDLVEVEPLNPRPVPPQLATRFTLQDAAWIAPQVKNGNGAQGEVVHVRHAIATALANQRELLALLLENAE